LIRLLLLKCRLNTKTEGTGTEEKNSNRTATFPIYFEMDDV
jgi:hypothetical protein